MEKGEFKGPFPVEEDKKKLGISYLKNTPLFMTADEGRSLLPGNRINEEARSAIEAGRKVLKPKIRRTVFGGVYAETAKKAIELYATYEGEVPKPTGMEFTPQPIEDSADTGMAFAVAALLINRDRFLARMKEEPEGKGIRDKILRKNTAAAAKLLDDVLVTWFKGNGIDPVAKKKVAKPDIASAATAFVEKNDAYRRAVTDWGRLLVRQMIDEAKKTEEFSKLFAGLKKETEPLIKKRYADCMASLKAAVASGGVKKEQVISLGEDMKRSFMMEDQLKNTRDALLRMDDFSEVQAEVTEFFREKLNFAAFASECVEQCLNYIVNLEEPDHLHGNYIRMHWGVHCNRVDPLTPVYKQIGLFDDKLTGFTPFELDKYPFTGLFEKRMREDEKPEANEEKLTFKQLAEKKKELEKLKDTYPDLFVEPGSLRIFRLIPQMIEIFEKAKRLRDALSAYAREAKEHTEEFKELYIFCCAVYDTLLKRHRFVIAASGCTPPQLMDRMTSYKTASFEYNFRECQKNLREI